MKRNNERIGTFWITLALLLAICLVGLSGCESTDKPKDTILASVIISGNTPGQIREAVKEVFRENGYQVSQTDAGGLILEKEASRMSNLAYGSWLGDSSVWIRVKTSIVPDGEMAFRLECSAFLVRDKGSAAEEELGQGKLHKKQYQKLLEEVAARFTRK
jgi:hypothetical protein